MEPDDLKDLEGDPRFGFVPGIYNDCDGRCDRCPFTIHCVKYALGGTLDERLARWRSDDETA